MQGAGRGGGRRSGRWRRYRSGRRAARRHEAGMGKDKDRREGGADPDRRRLSEGSGERRHGTAEDQEQAAGQELPPVPDDVAEAEGEGCLEEDGECQARKFGIGHGCRSCSLAKAPGGAGTDGQDSRNGGQGRRFPEVRTGSCRGPENACFFKRRRG